MTGCNDNYPIFNPQVYAVEVSQFIFSGHFILKGKFPTCDDSFKILIDNRCSIHGPSAIVVGYS